MATMINYCQELKDLLSFAIVLNRTDDGQFKEVLIPSDCGPLYIRYSVDGRYYERSNIVPFCYSLEQWAKNVTSDKKR